jgi:DNA invertase Pin-like site-specific DNA recombinase
MTVLGYIRVSSDKQDLQKQEHLLLKYAQQHDLQISDFIKLEISSRKNTKERRIDELLTRLNKDDILLVAELSRLGRNMFEVINIINQLSENGVKLIFVRQPELSTTGPHGKLLLAIYSYFAEAEREFISVRTKQGLAAARGRGKQLGRPKGSRDKERVLDPYREQIKEYLQLNLPLREERDLNWRYRPWIINFNSCCWAYRGWCGKHDHLPWLVAKPGPCSIAWLMTCNR